MQRTEEERLEMLRAHLAKGVGITQIGRNLTFRFRDQDEKLVSISAVVYSIDDGGDRCYSCDELLKEHATHDSTVRIDQCVGELRHNIKLCYDCYCPK